MLNKKLLTLACALLLCILLVITIFGQRALLHMFRIKEELKTLEEHNKQLKAENLALKKQIGQLKSNHRYLEDLARDELGLAKEDELIYEFKKKQK
jgi:cell division protein FtsB